MPELFRLFGLKFYFYSNEHLPVHVHVSNADGNAKFTIDPVVLIENKGLKSKDVKLAESLIEENAQIIDARWHEYFDER